MSPVDDLTSEVIGEKYELVRQLGRGGMGAVYEARHVGTLKRCAVKLLLKAELAADAEVHKRFFREARASGLIESEHVVAAYDSGIDALGRVYYVMECLQGEDLAQRLQRGPLRPSAAIKLALQASTGLASAHALGVVHRDIKPANLFLAAQSNHDLKVKILDFGVAKVKMEVFGESADSYTRGGSLLGTPQYMSPEQMKRASAINESADVWSLGVVMYECLTGKLPWGNVESIGELLAAILTAEVPSAQDQAPWVQPELAAIVSRALSRDLGHRLQNAAELRNALLALTSDVRLTARDLEPLSDEERSNVAPRIALADTVPIGESSSNLPVVTSTRAIHAPPRKRSLVAVALAAAAVTTAAAWALRPPPQGVVAQARPVESPSPVEVAATPPTVTPLPSVPVPTQRLPLRITPRGAAVLVDGRVARVEGGNVIIEGAIGSVHKVRVSHGKQSREERVFITVQGLEPNRLSLPSLAPGAPSPPEDVGAKAAPNVGQTTTTDLDPSF